MTISKSEYEKSLKVIKEYKRQQQPFQNVKCYIVHIDNSHTQDLGGGAYSYSSNENTVVFTDKDEANEYYENNTNATLLTSVINPKVR
jgi:hypothetical protein